MLPVQVRAATPQDVAAMVGLVLAGRRESLLGNQLCSPDGGAVAAQLGALGGLPGGVMLVAHQDETLVGLLLGRVVPPSAFADEASLAVEAVYVSPEHRRRGVGHALLGAVAEIAEQAGVSHVFAAPVPGARGMQRFFVRLGFGPAAGYRVTTPAALRRRLGQGPQPGRGHRGGSPIEDLIARRRHSRAVTGEIPVVPAAEVQDPSVAKRRQVSRAVHSRRDVESSTTIW